MSPEQIDLLVAERNAWRKLAIARGLILVGYRTNRTPAKGIDDALKAEEHLRDLNIDPTTGKQATA